MSYMTSNEMNHFTFENAVLNSINPMLTDLHLTLDNVGITSDNSQNRDVRNMRTNGLDFAVTDYTIASIVEEGYSVADADGNVYQSVPDRAIPQEEYNAAFEQIPGMSIDSIEKADGIYTICLRGEDHTWKLIVKGSGDTQKWNRFMNPGEDPDEDFSQLSEF